jgi:outer membrane protein OmpA-like peptidoglycan-associated protein
MSNLVKILLGGLLSAFFAWFMYGPMGLGAKCANTGAATEVAAAPVAAPDAPATAEAVKTCQADVDKAITGKTINFESGKAVIKVDSQPIIDALAAAAKDCAGTSVEVAGHTDQQGDDASNMKLSQARADAVVKALGDKGVPAARMSAKGYGETKLLDQGNSPEALAKNRRIEFHVASAAAATTMADDAKADGATPEASPAGDAPAADAKTQ